MNLFQFKESIHLRMFKIIGTCLVLITLTHLTNGQVTLSESKAAKDKAVRHILSKREFNHGWDGGHTIRVVTGLQLAEDGWYKDNTTILESASVRQRDAEILSVFAKDPNLLKTAPEVISEWVNSIISTCQDPAKFHGVNLIDILKKKLDTIPSGATRHAAQTVAVSLALCNAGVQVPNSAIVKINNDMKPNKGLCNFCIEGSSLTILAMQCIKAQQPDNKLINGINTRQIAYLKGKQNDDGGFGTTVATTLAIEAANVVGTQTLPINVAKALAWVMKDQDKEGGFGSLLTTALAAPMFIGRSILDVKNVKCKKEPPTLSPPSGKMNIKLVIEDAIYAQRSIESRIEASSGANLLKVLKDESDKHPKSFMFTTKNGLIETVNLVEPEPKNGWSWQTLKEIGSKKEVTTQSLENIKPKNNDKYILRFGKSL
ncbi:uncharacterized protein LOC136033646 [Artemia franciscana]|uniref:uncharacterized protein LOC136033646 n=1 Tax=Artemia franciscana TaxID=6661 RepID=UPI0032DAFC93